MTNPTSWLLSDADYEAHLRHTVDSVRAEMIQRGTTADRFKTTFGWSRNRRVMQDKVVNDFLQYAKATPRQSKAVLTGGRPGAGKSSCLEADRVFTGRYFHVDADLIKASMIQRSLSVEIPGVTPLEAAALIHQESCDIADRIISSLTLLGTNLVIDGTMAWGPYIEQHLSTLDAADYQTKAVFVEVSPATSQRRVLERHRRGVERFLFHQVGLGGRFVDPDVHLRPSTNRAVFESIKGHLAGWVVYDNDRDHDAPRWLASSDKTKVVVPCLTEGAVDVTELLDYLHGEEVTA